MAERAVAVVAWSSWMRRVGAEKSSFTGAFIAVWVMALANFLVTALLGLSVMPIHANFHI